MWFIDVRSAWFRSLPAAAAALLWALAAGSAALWSLQLPRSEAEMATVDVAPMASQPGPDHGGLARALGHVGEARAEADEQRRFQLLGVIAAAAGRGSALLAVDGRPARAVVQGQAVVDGWRLQFVTQQGVRLSAGQTGATLELALPVKP